MAVWTKENKDHDDLYGSCSAIRSSGTTSDLASADCVREAELGLLTSIGSGAVLDRALWFAILGATWLTLQCLPM